MKIRELCVHVDDPLSCTSKGNISVVVYLIVRATKSRRMRWVGHVSRSAEEERHIQDFGGKA